jgi:O-antigen ligase
MSKLLKLEKFVFYFLVFLLFLQFRIKFYSFGSQFNEWTSVFFYFTDILILSVFILWVVRALKEKEPFIGKIFFGWPPHQNIVGVNLVVNTKFSKECHYKSLISNWCGGWSGVFLGFFLLISAFSLGVTNKFWLSFYGFLKLAEFGILFLYLKNNFTKYFSLERFWRIFIAGAVLQSIVAIVQFFRQSSLGIKHLESPLNPSLAGVAKIVVNGENYIRAYGLVPHPNILAAILVIAIFGLVYLFLKTNINLKCHFRPESVIPAKAPLSGAKAGIQFGVNSSGNLEKKSGFRIKCGMTECFIFILALILILTALFFTFSRAVTIVGFLVLLFWAATICIRQKNYRRQVIIFIVLLLAISSLLFAVFWPYASARYELQGLGQSQALNLRVFYNRVALDFIKGSPVFGIGQSNFVLSLSSLNLLSAWAYQPVHNIYLLIAAETGLLGLLAFLVFLFFTLKSAWSHRREFAVSSLSFIVFCLLLIGLFDHFFWDLQQGQIILWLFLGILASLAAGPYGSTDKAQPSGG